MWQLHFMENGNHQGRRSYIRESVSVIARENERVVSLGGTAHARPVPTAGGPS
jgi:hypothetical protein